MQFDRLAEFRRAYAAVPSQDNEGWVPDRAGFKAGFYASCNVLQPRIAELEAALRETRRRLVDVSECLYIDLRCCLCGRGCRDAPATDSERAEWFPSAALDAAGRGDPA